MAHHAAIYAQTPSHALSRSLTLAYGLVSYALFFGTFLYLIGFIAGFGVPKTLDSGVPGNVGSAIAIDLGLLALFAIQHTIMARSAFKRWWTTVIPEPIERSTFVLVTSLLLCLIAWQWQPIPGVVWQVEGIAAVAIYGIAALGWLIVLASTFIIDHFDLFGLRQTACYAFRREYRPPRYKEVQLYRYCRHPLMLGFLVAFWATPTMTASHLLFAAVCTGYILAAIRIEERTLVELHGEAYEDYRRRVPALIPRLR
jgi:protein-S-isoprenylcysteine O-methyltransferase Ste14